MTTERRGPSLWRSTVQPESADHSYRNPQKETKVLAAGWKLTDAHAPFQVDTIWEKNVKIRMRDGCQIYVDIFRPHDAPASTVPALLAWSPYGKSACHTGGFNPLDMIPGRVGVPQNRLSGFEKFEAPDPAEWTARGYAIVNPDPRGTYDSEGDIHHFGAIEANDGYDTIEYLAGLSWCNGSVALVGNSWLGIAQWFIAATQPPHLKCIAPLEGAGDLYRDILCRGGIPQTPFWDFLSGVLRGRNRQEDVVGMLKKYPLMNEYWADKRADMTKIQVPAYVLASYSTFLHTFGSFRGFTEIPHNKKWLRVHPTQEWHDLYQESTNRELQKFFDFYTKGIDNGWEETPRARLSLLRYNNEPLVNQIFPDWPIPSTSDRTLYLHGDNCLAEESSDTPETLSYISDVPFRQTDADSEELSFTHTFKDPCALVGSSRAVLYLSCEEGTDMDVFVQIRKADVNGKVLRNINIPAGDRRICNMPEPVDLINPLVYLGPTGCLRASHRALDPKLSNDWWPEHDYSTKQPIRPGEVVKLDIGLWQTGIYFEPGEKLIVKVAGHNMTLAEFPDLQGAMVNYNRGRHVLHVGGPCPSRLIIPTIPDFETKNVMPASSTH
ncbi:alpha/beta-hydrolase [Aspergillus pseudonomiae]|uniref:Alpha/beta-hydrolase n=1 Tax=Aspergillus pseudonomiae TaxID=1506151 RepID=A0A5N7DIY2_9EURO|nr:alpha/beta-hydrolase [Aspergillus pseudonomiae]KAE8406400.1 alpha/beta-hydrolase [Aspergillus pseudonomiae]